MILDSSFGNSLRCLRRAIGRKDGYVVVVALSNESCRRLNRCTQFDALPGISVSELNQRVQAGDRQILGWYRDRAREVTLRLRMELPRARIWLSIGLEDAYTDETAYRLIRAVSRASKPLGVRRVVRNPVSNVAQVSMGEDMMLLHGKSPVFRPDTPMRLRGIGLDGVSLVCRPGDSSYSPRMTESRVRDWMAANPSKVVMLWNHRWQGVFWPLGQTPRFVPPRDRRFEIDRCDILAARRLL